MPTRSFPSTVPARAKFKLAARERATALCRRGHPAGAFVGLTKLRVAVLAVKASQACSPSWLRLLLLRSYSLHIAEVACLSSGAGVFEDERVAILIGNQLAAVAHAEADEID